MTDKVIRGFLPEEDLLKAKPAKFKSLKSEESEQEGEIEIKAKNLEDYAVSELDKYESYAPKPQLLQPNRRQPSAVSLLIQDPN